MRVQPMTCWRPAPNRAADFATLPYDVFDRKSAAGFVAAHPHSFLGIDRPETAFPPDYDMYAPEVYEKAAQIVRERMADGTLVHDEKPCYYLYRLEQGGRAQIGVACAVSVDDYDSGVVRRHENTLPRKEIDRVQHIRALDMQTGPVFLVYRDDEGVDKLVERAAAARPLYDFVDEGGVRHTVWRLADDDTVAALTSAFERVATSYIADGHHRAASAVQVCHELREANGSAGDAEGNENAGARPYDGFLSVLFPASQLEVLPYNRVVHDLNGMSVVDFVARVTRAYEVQYVQEPPLEPLDKGAMAMYVGGKWHGLALRPEFESAHPVLGLDVAALQNHILGPVLGIQNPRTNPRLEFVGGNVGPEELAARAGKEGVAFSLFPTSLDELFAVSDAGLLMPPKSTWFEPKLLSGLWLRPLH